MPTYLLVLISVLVCVAIVACLIAIIAYRRMSIAYRKLDYLVEDVAYKSEVLTPVVNTIAKLAEKNRVQGSVKSAEELSEVLAGVKNQLMSATETPPATKAKTRRVGTGVVKHATRKTK